jgi:hypothetical protein
MTEAEPKKFYRHFNNENDRKKAVCIVHLSSILWLWIRIERLDNSIYHYATLYKVVVLITFYKFVAKLIKLIALNPFIMIKC